MSGRLGRGCWDVGAVGSGLLGRLPGGHINKAETPIDGRRSGSVTNVYLTCRPLPQGPKHAGVGGRAAARPLEQVTVFQVTVFFGSGLGVEGLLLGGVLGPPASSCPPPSGGTC